jgi:hypothetical protein
VTPGWDRDALAASPRFAVLRPVLAGLPAHAAPALDELNAVAAARNLVNAAGRPVRFVRAGAVQDYEWQVHQTGEVPTREASWHDLFNALAWLAFPASKASLNRLHVAHRAGAGAGRGTARDVLTLFDEDGLVMATADPLLADLLREFRWRELFVERRADVLRDARFLGFGHALHEKLLAPFRGLTAKVIVVPVDRATLAGAVEALAARVDAALAAMLGDADVLASTRSLAPLPVQGIPAWWDANEDPDFYDDTGQFRRGRRK